MDLRIFKKKIFKKTKFKKVAKKYARKNNNRAKKSQMDKNFAEIGGKFIICLREDYSDLVDDQYPDQLPTTMLTSLAIQYRNFAEWTKCDYLILYTDDMDLNKQVEKIKIFFLLNLLFLCFFSWSTFLTLLTFLLFIVYAIIIV